MIAAHDAAARESVADLLSDVTEGKKNHDLLEFMNGLALFGTLPDEIAGTLVDLCGNDIDKLISALKHAQAEFDRLIQSTACRAAIQIKKGA